MGAQEHLHEASPPLRQARKGGGSTDELGCDYPTALDSILEVYVSCHI